METSNQRMCEALDALQCIDTRGLKRLLFELVEADIFDHGQINKTISAVDRAKAALSAPLRNCDVGTAEEQARRMNMYCSMHGKDESGCYRCEKCKLMRVDRCELAWSQMPYEEGGNNADE